MRYWDAGDGADTRGRKLDGEIPISSRAATPLQVLEFIGRAARREPPCKPMFAVWHWMQDRILLHAQRCHVLPIDHDVSYTSRASRLHAYTQMSVLHVYACRMQVRSCIHGHDIRMAGCGLAVYAG